MLTIGRLVPMLTALVPLNRTQRTGLHRLSNMSSSRDSLKHLDDAGSLETQPGPPHKRSTMRSFLPYVFPLPRSCVAPSAPTAMLGT